MAISQHKEDEVILLDNYRLEPLTDFERKFATENHNLVYGFLHRYGYSLEIYYDIAIFGFLKAVQIYNHREDLRNKYDFPFISWQYMRSEIGNHFRIENAKKRKPAERLISLDADCVESENLHDCITTAAGGKSPESEIFESESLMEILGNLSEVQRRITKMKIDGYNNKEIYLILEIKPSTYYKELQRIRKILKEVTG